MGQRARDFDPYTALRYFPRNVPIWVPDDTLSNSAIMAATAVSAMTVGTALTLSGDYVTVGGKAFLPHPAMTVFTTSGALDITLEFDGYDQFGIRNKKQVRISETGASTERLSDVPEYIWIESITPVILTSGGANTISFGLDCNVSLFGEMGTLCWIPNSAKDSTAIALNDHSYGALAEQQAAFAGLNLKADFGVSAGVGLHKATRTRKGFITPASAGVTQGPGTIVLNFKEN